MERMRIVLCWCLLLTVCAAALGVDWASYESAEGQFAVNVPGKPEIVVEHNQTPLGQVDEHTCRWRSGPVEWVVEYSDLPDAALSLNGSILFVQVRRGFQHTTGQPVKNETVWKFGSNPGRTFEFYFAAGSAAPTRSGIARATLVDHRLYVLTVTWDKPAIPVPADEASRFFDSFRLNHALNT
jgi:hypothetical protein